MTGLKLSDRIDAVLNDAFESLGLPVEHARCVPCGRPELADLQCNGAMPSARAVHRHPLEVADMIAATLSDLPEFCEVSVAGPGFVNLRIAPTLLAEFATEMAADPQLGIVPTASGNRSLVIDSGGPNVAKPLHVGHLRSLLLGDSLKRILSALGWSVVSDAHLGDWGLQMGMLTSAIRRQQPDLPCFLPGASCADLDVPVTLAELERLYPEAAAACRSDPERMAEARADTAALQSYDPGLIALWLALRAMSLKSQVSDFRTLGIEFDLLLGESDAQPLIAPMIADLRKRGIAVESDGALVIEVGLPGDRKEMPPLLLTKTDGAALYATTDLATLADRAGCMGVGRVVYVVDQRQALHFEQVFRAAAKSGLSDGTETVHVGFGTVNGPDGKPYKTRQGGVARLSDLLAEAVAKAAERIDESGHGAELHADEKAALACMVGIAAVKFADLSGDRMSGYVFDPERLVSFEGRTGPYLQYACVRIRSILAKAAERGDVPGTMLPMARTECDLLLGCLGFPAAVADAGSRMQPGAIAEFAFGLAQRFSRFYADCPVLGADDPAERASRLAMCGLVDAVLGRALFLLGIEVPNRM